MGWGLVHMLEWLWEASIRSQEKKNKTVRHEGAKSKHPKHPGNRIPSRRNCKCKSLRLGNLWSVLGGHNRVDYFQLFLVEFMELVFFSYLFGFLQLAWSTFTISMKYLHKNGKNIPIWKENIASYSLCHYSLRWVLSAFHFLKIHAHTFWAKFKAICLFRLSWEGLAVRLCASNSVWDSAVSMLCSLPCLHPPTTFD